MLERVRCPIAAVQADGHEAVRAGDALIVEIVDRVNRSRVSELAAAAKSGMEIDRQQRRMPVVRVDDVRRDAEALTTADDGAAEEREALDAIVVAVDARRVNLRTVKVVVIADEHERDVRAR